MTNSNSKITILMTAPRKIGDPTWYTSQWSYKMEQLARSMGYNVVVLRGDNVTYRNVTAAINKLRPRLYIHTGHGCPSALNGQNECILTRKFSANELMEMGEKDPEQLDRLLHPVKLGGCGKSICNLNEVQGNACGPLCLKDTNIHLLSGSIIYSVSCHSAEQLGKYAVLYGVESFVGYDDLLLFPVDSMRSQDMFGEVQLEMLKGLLEGRTVGESFYNMVDMQELYIRLYKPTKWVALPLLWNKLHSRVLGNIDARLY